MPKLMVIVGLPGSGKTTKARKVVEIDPENTIRVNYDDLRKMFWNHPHKSYKREGFVREILQQIMESACGWQLDIIVDNVNLGRNLSGWNDWAEYHHYTLEIAFIDIPIEECIERDKLREFPVGEKVIRRFAGQMGEAHVEAAEIQNR